MSFNKIIGQELAKKILLNAMRNNKIPNAYLFYGEDGVGKFLVAVAFAKAVNCLEKEWDFCDKCRNCRLIDEKRTPDFKIVEPEDTDQIKIDTIRDIKKEVGFKKVHLKRRFVIIREAEKMNREAQNAFLKTLEEPPSDTTFILITRNIFGLYPTIISRCQKIRFRKLKKEEIKKYLEDNLNMVSAYAEDIASISQGRLDIALKIASGELLALNQMVRKFIEADVRKKLQILGEIEDLEEFLHLLLWNLKEKLKEIDEKGRVIGMIKDVEGIYWGIRHNIPEDLIKCKLADIFARK